MKPGDTVRYSNPQKGEESFRFTLLELHADATPPRAHIALICDDRIQPVETVDPSEIELASAIWQMGFNNGRLDIDEKGRIYLVGHEPMGLFLDEIDGSYRITGDGYDEILIELSRPKCAMEILVQRTLECTDAYAEQFCAENIFSNQPTMPTPAPITHTPLPWKAEPRLAYTNVAIYGKGRKHGQHKQHVAEIWSGDDRSMQVAKANSDLIIRAVNNHHELLDLLRAAVARVELENSEGNPILSAWLSDARAAITKASTQS